MNRHIIPIGYLTMALCLLAYVAILPAQSPLPTSAPPAGQSVPSPTALDEHHPHLDGEQATLPIVVVKGYPFLEGEVNGVKGKLLLDVGELSAFVINTHRVTPPNGIVIGHGNFGSGETFSVSRFPSVDDLKLPGGLEYKDSTRVRGNTGELLENHITPDFLGWIGLDFFDGYIMKLNYEHSDATFYKNDASGSGTKKAVEGERVLEVIPFQNEGHRNVPTSRIHIGSTSIDATFDTGSHVSLWLDQTMIDHLKKDGVLSQGPDNSYTLSGLKIGERQFGPMRAEVTEGRSPIAKDIGNTDGNVITLGYEFLSQFKTLWNYQNDTITLLKQ